MPINPLWREFYGGYLVILAALIAVITLIVIHRRDRSCYPVVICAFLFQGAGIVLFSIWFLQSDPLFWHRQGPSSFLFAALGSLVAGIIAVAYGWALMLVPQDDHNLSRRSELRGCFLTGLTILSVLAIFIGVSRLPRAVSDMKIAHFNALQDQGAKALGQLISGLKDDDPYIQGYACMYLGFLGPEAKNAVPDLIAYIENPAAYHKWMAIEALGEIGPYSEPAIPVLVRHAEQRELPFNERRGAEQALRRMGPKADWALREVIQFNQELAGKQLPARMAELDSTDLEKVDQAANALKEMGAYAVPALARMRSRLAEIRKDEAKYQDPAVYDLEFAINSIAQESIEHPIDLVP